MSLALLIYAFTCRHKAEVNRTRGDTSITSYCFTDIVQELHQHGHPWWSTMTDGAKLDLIGQNIPISMLPRKAIFLLGNKGRRRQNTRGGSWLEMKILASTLHVGYIDTVRPACGSDAVIVGAQPPSRSIQIVFHMLLQMDPRRLFSLPLLLDFP
jgi:hypothetical protein